MCCACFPAPQTDTDVPHTTVTHRGISPACGAHAGVAGRPSCRERTGPCGMDHAGRTRTFGRPSPCRGCSARCPARPPTRAWQWPLQCLSSLILAPVVAPPPVPLPGVDQHPLPAARRLPRHAPGHAPTSACWFALASCAPEGHRGWPYPRSSPGPCGEYRVGYKLRAVSGHRPRPAATGIRPCMTFVSCPGLGHFCDFRVGGMVSLAKLCGGSLSSVRPFDFGRMATPTFGVAIYGEGKNAGYFVRCQG